MLYCPEACFFLSPDHRGNTSPAPAAASCLVCAQSHQRKFSEESTIYSDLKVHCSSNTQNGKITKTSKTKVSPWCIAAVIFAFLYIITLVIVAAMVAKIHCLEESLQKAAIETAHCNIISQNKG
ncbi:uncharacterized protein [Macaca nemestrina]|uniref:uncharacterized protein isoform X3 n=1 Tax=Macaca nemestrina TaxID=9545 RepID=UPI0039B990AF